jgi:S1-C subfamily serine protease
MPSSHIDIEVPDHPPPWRPRRRLGAPAAGAIAGVAAAAVLGGAGLLTGVIGGHTTRVIQSEPIATNGHARIDARAIYAREAPGVVQVTATGVAESTPFGQQEGSATGSGLVLDRKGDILTNSHVVNGAQSIHVTFQNGSPVPATVLGRDTSTDLAVLKVDPSKATLDPLPLGDSKRVQVGDPVVAIGNPFGLDRTLTEGIISAKQRQITAPDGFAIDNVLQTDAPINPGNSGGPLIDAAGRVIGINSQIATGGSGSGSVGIGFAVPIDTARSELPALERGGTIGRGFLGVTVAPLSSDLARVLGIPTSTKGVLVQQVAPGSPAAKARLHGGSVATDGGILLGGDVITAVDGKAVTSPSALSAAVDGHRSGQTVTVTYLRGTSSRTVRVKLAPRPVGDDTSGGSTPGLQGLGGLVG